MTKKYQSRIHAIRRWNKAERSKRIALGICVVFGCSNKPTSKRRVCEPCRIFRNTYQTETRRMFRKLVLEHFGAKCACPQCPETNPRFLTVDHINNDGAVHRKQLAGQDINKWLVLNNFPDGFRLLCFNCNLGRQHNKGTCPHIGYEQ